MNKQKRTTKSYLQQALTFLQEFWDFIKNTTVQIGRALRELWHNFLRSFTRWADPRLEKYRERPLHTKVAEDAPKTIEKSPKIIPEAPTAPTNRDELFALLREAPMTVLGSHERKIMSSLFELEDTPVSGLMTPASKIVYVKQSETLGPLVLDKLYRSGFENFPVVDGHQHIIGTLQTSQLNRLDIKDTPTAGKLMNPHVNYVRDDYTLAQALKAFLRTGEQLFIVTDRYEKTVGLLTFRQLLEFLFGGELKDNFHRDDDRIAVAKRK